MTQVTPPGWYPDPGQTTDGPRTERWWDGGAWTDRIRPAEAAAGWGPPGYPPGAYPVPEARPRRLRIVIGTLVVLVVLACIGGGVYALTDGGGKDSASSAPSGAPSRGSDGGGSPGRPGVPGGPDGPGAPDGPAPKTEEGYATDTASGISLPVPDGWKGESGAVGAQVTTGTYTCPGDTKQTCVRGGAFSAPALALKLEQSSAKAAAEADIAKNAEESYGGKTYGKISSHQQLASRAVQVAGEQGYLVRWKVVTGKGDDGYVESLVFPSPASQDMLVVVRFGFDVNDKAPKVSAMDDITKGIKKAAGQGGGNGRQV
ncbi:DUF2510 domain-containing protein [Streptomyces sulfonofaciens]|nr:DUF2510 domain-containing protein [Streptomyces sulfonofaciens]